MLLILLNLKGTFLRILVLEYLKLLMIPYFTKIYRCCVQIISSYWSNKIMIYQNKSKILMGLINLSWNLSKTNLMKTIKNLKVWFQKLRKVTKSCKKIMSHLALNMLILSVNFTIWTSNLRSKILNGSMK